MLTGITWYTGDLPVFISAQQHFHLLSFLCPFKEGQWESSWAGVWPLAKVNAWQLGSLLNWKNTLENPLTIECKVFISLTHAFIYDNIHLFWLDFPIASNTFFTFSMKWGQLIFRTSLKKKKKRENYSHVF